MSVDNVERIVWELQRVDISGLEGDVGDFLSGCERSCLFERIGDVFYACDVALGNEPGQIYGDGTGAAADVEDCHVLFYVWDEVACRVGSSAPAMGA